MARRADPREMQALYKTDDYVMIGDKALKEQFGWTVHQLGDGWIKTELYRTLREFLDDPDRPGIYAFMRVHKGTTKRKPHEGPHLRIYTSDDNLRLEIRMRYS